MTCVTRFHSVLYLQNVIKPLYLNIFRGEPAISGFVWHIAPNLKSSQPIATDTSAGLPPIFIGVHPAQGQLTQFRVFSLLQNWPVRPCFHYVSPTKLVKLNAVMSNSPVHSSIGTTSSCDFVCLLANNFSSFHFPPGMLFTFPSRYQFTIGRFWYLALERGRPRFPQSLSCSMVLRYKLSVLAISLTSLSLSMEDHSGSFCYHKHIECRLPCNPTCVVQAVPLSLTATNGISYDLYSWRY